MTKVLNFNTAAGALIGENTRIRVKTVDGQIHVLPTTRTNEKKHIQMFDLRAKGKGFRVTVPDDLIGDVTAFTLQPAKHHWLVLVPGEKQVVAPGKAALAGGSVSER